MAIPVWTANVCYLEAITGNWYHQEREKWLFPRIIYKRAGLHKVAVDLVSATEMPGSIRVMESGGKHYLWPKTCINICCANCVLVRVPINNYNYEQPVGIFVILIAKNTFTWCNFMY